MAKVDGKYDIGDEKQLKDQQVELVDNTYETRLSEAM